VTDRQTDRHSESSINCSFIKHRLPSRYWRNREYHNYTVPLVKAGSFLRQYITTNRPTRPTELDVILYKICRYVSLSVSVYISYSRPNGWADRDQTCMRIHLDPGSVLGKSRSRSECRRCENRGADRNRREPNAVWMRIEAPTGTDGNRTP